MRKLAREIPKFDNHERFLKFIVVDSESGCWNWAGHRNKEGYGVFQIGKGSYGAHRISYSIFVKNPAIEMLIDHICRNKSCVCPDHLREVNHRENSIENSISTAYFNSIKSECKFGHPLMGENIYRRKNGSRECYTCRRLKGPIYKQRQRLKNVRASKISN